MIRYSPFEYNPGSLPPTEAVRRVLGGDCPPVSREAREALEVTLAWCMVRDEAEALASGDAAERSEAFAAEWSAYPERFEADGVAYVKRVDVACWSRSDGGLFGMPGRAVDADVRAAWASRKGADVVVMDGGGR